MKIRTIKHEYYFYEWDKPMELIEELWVEIDMRRQCKILYFQKFIDKMVYKSTYTYTVYKSKFYNPRGNKK